MPFRLPACPKLGPCYHPITEQWQKEKCQLLGIAYVESLEQQPALAGSLLSQFIPWQTEKIGMDGNCFFRCISKMVSGPENHHVKLRAELCRYMVTDGKSIVNRYLKTFSNDRSPVTYLKTSAMTENNVWASDVEVMAISCMLDSDVFISTELYDATKLWTRKIWHRYSDHARDPNAISIYISNINHNHYEPVIRLMNSEYESFKVPDVSNNSTNH